MNMGLGGFNLEEEVICDYLVTSKVKKLWATELDLAEQLKRICDKHGITYYAAGGTLLGAVRHKGFIPWDDDMDFLMMKEDYDRFCEVAPHELEEPYSFQRTMSLSRIRNSDTTGCTQVELENAIPPYNLGIFIDIFPLTSIPDEPKVRMRHRRLVNFMRLARRGQRLLELDSYFGRLSFASYLRGSVAAWVIVSRFLKGDMIDAYLDLCAKYDNQNTREVGITSFLTYNDRYIWKREWFEGERINLPFANIYVPAPLGYDSILRKSFGDYSVFVKNAAQHAMPICDPDTPYTVYSQRALS